MLLWVIEKGSSEMHLQFRIISMILNAKPRKPTYAARKAWIIKQGKLNK